MSVQAVQLPSDDTASQELIEESIDRYVRRCRDALGDLVRDEGFTGAVSEHRGIQHDRMRRQVRELGEQLAERERGQIGKRDSILVTAELPPGLFDEPGVKFRSACHEDNACRVGVDSKSGLQRGRELSLQEHARHMAWQCTTLDLSSVDPAEDDSCARKHQVSLAQEEIERGAHRRHDNINLLRGVLRTKVVAKQWQVGV